jgi:DNA-binding transcriptional LysR family regulator
MLERQSLAGGGEDVTFAQLRTFACAASAGSFVKAGQRLDISQAAVSEQIRTLEVRLGRCLFERRRGTTPVLTAEGEQALEIVQSILASCDGLFRKGRDTHEKVMLRISVGPYLRDVYLKALLPRIYRDHPDVEIQLCPAGATARIARQLEAGEIDLAIFAISASEESPPLARPVCELPLVMIAPPGTRARLAARQCALDDFQFIFLGNKETGARGARKLLRDLGLAPRSQPLFVEFVEALAQMVADGHGIGHLTANSVAADIEAGRVEPLGLPLTPMRRLIGRSAQAPDVARAVEETLREALSA